MNGGSDTRRGVMMLSEAQSAINDRGENYGTPLDNFTRIANLWSVVLGVEVQPHEVGLCMDLVKTARLIETPDHYDSWVDKAGYAAATVECFEKGNTTLD
tara:strand:- start:2112 stop:2411 length:300 start_codon:yes stop_codon:yes gene_type:complete